MNNFLKAPPSGSWAFWKDRSLFILWQDKIKGKKIFEMVSNGRKPRKIRSYHKDERKIHLFMILCDSDKFRSVATLFIEDRLKIFFSNLLRTVSCIALILVKLDSLDFLPFPFLSGIFRLIPVAASISRSNSGSCQPLSSA